MARAVIVPPYGPLLVQTFWVEAAAGHSDDATRIIITIVRFVLNSCPGLISAAPRTVYTFPWEFAQPRPAENHSDSYQRAQ